MHLLIALTLVAALFAPVADAGPRSSTDYRPADEDLRYAQVLESRPVYVEVGVAEPRRECWSEAQAGQGLPAAIDGGSGRQSGLADNPYRAVRYVDRCRTVIDHRVDQRIDGYDVTYRYKGRVYTTRMPYDPGSRVPVRSR